MVAQAAHQRPANGHLSTAAASGLLAAAASPRWRHVYLTHLSRECNSRAAVKLAFAALRCARQTCRFSIVEQGETTPWCELG